MNGVFGACVSSALLSVFTFAFYGQRLVGIGGMGISVAFSKHFCDHSKRPGHHLLATELDNAQISSVALDDSFTATYTTMGTTCIEDLGRKWGNLSDLAHRVLLGAGKCVYTGIGAFDGPLTIAQFHFWEGLMILWATGKADDSGLGWGLDARHRRKRLGSRQHTVGGRARQSWV